MVGCWGHWHSEFTKTARTGVSVSSSSSSSTSSSSSSSASFSSSSPVRAFPLAGPPLTSSLCPPRLQPNLPTDSGRSRPKTFFGFCVGQAYIFTNALSRQGPANHCRTKPRLQQVLTTHVSANAPSWCPRTPGPGAIARAETRACTDFCTLRKWVHPRGLREREREERGIEREGLREGEGEGEEAHFAVRGPRTTGSRQSRRGWKDPQALGGSSSARKPMQSDPPALPPEVHEPAPAKAVQLAKAARPTKATQGYVQGFSRVLANRAPRSRFRFSGAATQDIWDSYWPA